mmetsp:Transcript_17788/g.41039  ORF Transcript_17788/g.41039 Transcript_17788/m.41039 type:complete len:474 (+) Transcript_17788:46-1467(+)
MTARPKRGMGAVKDTSPKRPATEDGSTVPSEEDVGLVSPSSGATDHDDSDEEFDRVICTEEDLRRCVADLRAYTEQQRSLGQDAVLAVDIEGVDLSRHGRACLLQIADLGGRVFLVDLVRIGDPEAIHRSGLAALLERRDVTKVFHDARRDCDSLFHQFGVRVYGLWDTQVADWIHRRLCGSQTDHLLGLGRLLQLKDLTKDVQTEKEQVRQLYADDIALWARRPLPRYLIRYARRDVMFLLALRLKQRAELHLAVSYYVPVSETQVTAIVEMVSEARAEGTVSAQRCHCAACTTEEEGTSLTLFDVRDLSCLTRWASFHSLYHVLTGYGVEETTEPSVSSVCRSYAVYGLCPHGQNCPYSHDLLGTGHDPSSWSEANLRCQRLAAIRAQEVQAAATLALARLRVNEALQAQTSLALAFSGLGAGGLPGLGTLPSGPRLGSLNGFMLPQAGEGMPQPLGALMARAMLSQRQGL